MFYERENRGNYRRRLIVRTIIPVLGIPLCIPWGIRYFAPVDSTWFNMLMAEIGCVLIWNFIWVQWEDFRQKREAKRLGARMVPRYKGKWPGNLDFLWALTAMGKDGYLGQLFEQVLREHGTTTLNLRILWNDAVSPE